MIRLKDGDDILELDELVSNDEIDTFEKLPDEKEDTLELFLDLFNKGENDGE